MNTKAKNKSIPHTDRSLTFTVAEEGDQLMTPWGLSFAATDITLEASVCSIVAPRAKSDPIGTPPRPKTSVSVMATSSASSGVGSGRILMVNVSLSDPAGKTIVPLCGESVVLDFHVKISPSHLPSPFPLYVSFALLRHTRSVQLSAPN